MQYYLHLRYSAQLWWLISDLVSTAYLYSIDANVS